MPIPVKPGIIGIDRGLAAEMGVFALFLFQERGVYRDLISGATAPLGGLQGDVTVGPGGLAATFNGTTQAQRLSTLPIPISNLFNSASGGPCPIIAARFMATGAQASNPGSAFGLYGGNITQAGFGVGMDTSNNVGCLILDGNGTTMPASSPGVIGTWYTVFAQLQMAANPLNYAWINGLPASNQGATHAGTWVGTPNEVAFGAEDRASGFLRFFTGQIEWAAVINNTLNSVMTNDQAMELYESGFPYNLILPKRGLKYWWKTGGAVTAKTPWQLWQRKAA